MNHFLASLEVTFRRDPTNFRPRVNKLNSVKDREQKGMALAPSVALTFVDAIMSTAMGNYFFLEE
jgi:hypothetical protein